MFKNAKVVMLPTNNGVITNGDLTQATTSCSNPVWEEGELAFCTCPWGGVEDEWKSQYLYILSDEEIQVGDWCYNSKNQLFKVKNSTGNILYNPNTNEPYQKWGGKKVIASTDLKLNVSIWDDFNKTIAKGMESGKLPKPDVEGLPRPSKAFIQKYVELGGIDEVMVEYIENPLVHETIVEFETRLERGDTEGHDLKNDYLPKISKNNTITIYRTLVCTV